MLLDLKKKENEERETSITNIDLTLIKKGLPLGDLSFIDTIDS